MGARDAKLGAQAMKARRAFMVVGAALLLIAAGLAVSNICAATQAKAWAAETYDQVRQQMGDASMSGSVANRTTASVAVGGRAYMGTVDIASLDLNLPVATSWMDEGDASLGAYRYAGSVADGDLIIAVHNPGALFGDLARAADGDSVELVDANGIQHTYRIAGIETIPGDDPKAAKAHADEWDLSLFALTFGERDRTVLRCVAA